MNQLVQNFFLYEFLKIEIFLKAKEKLLLIKIFNTKITLISKKRQTLNPFLLFLGLILLDCKKQQ